MHILWEVLQTYAHWEILCCVLNPAPYWPQNVTKLKACCKNELLWNCETESHDNIIWSPKCSLGYSLMRRGFLVTLVAVIWKQKTVSQWATVHKILGTAVFKMDGHTLTLTSYKWFGPLKLPLNKWNCNRLNDNGQFSGQESENFSLNHWDQLNTTQQFKHLFHIQGIEKQIGRSPILFFSSML